MTASVSTLQHNCSSRATQSVVCKNASQNCDFQYVFIHFCIFYCSKVSCGSFTHHGKFVIIMKFPCFSPIFALELTVNIECGYYRSFPVRSSINSLPRHTLFTCVLFSVTHERVRGMLRYSAFVLRQLRNANVTVTLSARKAIFSDGLWCPHQTRERRTDLNDTVLMTSSQLQCVWSSSISVDSSPSIPRYIGDEW